MSPARSHKGFSLLELLVVLFIVGIVSTLAVPKMMGSMSRTKLKTAVKQVAASLRYARSTAASQKITRTVRVDLGNSRVSVSGGKAASEPAGEAEGQAAGKETKETKPEVFDLPREVRVEKAIWGEEFIEEGVFEIHFFPNGGSSGGKLVLGNDRGSRYGITIDLITGMVKLTQDPEELEDRGIRRARSGFAVITPGSRRGLAVIR